MKALIPADEAARLAALRQCRILDSAPDAYYDDIARFAAHVCGTPIAAVSLIDADRQWFKSIQGMDAGETARDVAFCAHTILQPDLLVVPDARDDCRFYDNPMVVGDPGIRFYAGAPLVTSDGHALGSLCVIDRVPRRLTLDQETALRVLARQVSERFEVARRQDERERMTAEREAGEAEQRRLAAIVEAATDAIWSADLDGRITSWNAGAERLYGYPAAQVLGWPYSALLSPEEGEFLPDVIRALGRGEACENIQTHRLCEDGQWHDISLTFSTMGGMDGAFTGVSAFARDITSQKQNEAALQKEREFIRALLESLQEGIVACDADGTLTLFNPAARAFHALPDLPAETARWAEHFDLFQADGETPMTREDAPLSRAFRGEVVEDAEMVVKPRRGEARTLMASGQAIRNADGETLGAVVAMHDITERKAIERMKTEFVSVVSHELRTPLTSVRGALGLITGGFAGEVPELVKPLIEIAYGNTERLVQLINDILDIDKIESGEVDFPLGPVPLCPLLAQAVESMALYAAQHDVTLTLEESCAGPPEGFTVRAERDRLMQVLTNLLSNAAKFSPPGDVVSVGAERRGGTIRVTVRDHGPGIPTDFQDRIFQKFAQADSADTRLRGGTGLGLSICKVLVERFGGEIGFTTAPGAGTTFTVDLLEDHPPAPDSGGAGGERRRGDRRRGDRRRGDRRRGDRRANTRFAPTEQDRNGAGA